MTPEQEASLIIGEILADMKADRIPDDGSVGTFSELHNYVDANEYIIHARESFGLSAVPTEWTVENKACDLVTKWLDERMLDHRKRIRRLDTGEKPHHIREKK